ncbi:MAG TPA: short chain dehydrogenase [Devosiaceae bacterium]|nr:short chain dehydrogenase [Devosiaceae bacterium]
MKIIVIGATGIIGSAVAKALAGKHEVIGASRKSTSHPVDITDAASIRYLFSSVGQFDAVVSVAGGAAYKPLAELTDADFAMSLGYKLMGQINVARLAVSHLPDGGSITLTSGTYALEAGANGAAIAVVNSGIHGFVTAAAAELPRGLRINAVSPPFVGALKLNETKSHVESMTAEDVALAYLDAVDGHATGSVIDTRRYARR